LSGFKLIVSSFFWTFLSYKDKFKVYKVVHL